MKRLCLVLAFLFLFSQTAFAMPLLIGQKVVYRGTATGLRISSVDGTAFLDNAGATIPTYADGNHQIEIYDSSNRMLRGVLKAAGSSEGLGDELISSWTNNVTNPYETFTSVGKDITSAINTTAVGYCVSTVGVSSNKLYKGVTNLTLNSGTAPALRLYDTNVVIISSTGAQTGYVTATPTSIAVGYYTSVATDFSVTASLKQVTAPSSAGATIVSAKGGTTYNFNHKNASFAYNAASYYVIIKRLR